MNRLDEIITRHMQHESVDDAAAARIVNSLCASLPRQRHSLFDHWPSLFLNRDYTPAWPRLAALACVAIFGCMVGFVTPGLQKSSAATVRIADIDVGSLAFDSEPITGARP